MTTSIDKHNLQAQSNKCLESKRRAVWSTPCWVPIVIANKKKRALVTRYKLSAIQTDILSEIIISSQKQTVFGQYCVDVAESKWKSRQEVAEEFEVSVKTIKNSEHILVKKGLLISTGMRGCSSGRKYALSELVINHLTGNPPKRTTTKHEDTLSQGMGDTLSQGMGDTLGEGNIVVHRRGSDIVIHNNYESHKNDAIHEPIVLTPGTIKPAIVPTTGTPCSSEDRNQIIITLKGIGLDINYDKATHSELKQILQDTLKLADKKILGMPPIPSHLQIRKQNTESEKKESIVPLASPKKSPPPHEKRRLMVLSLQGTVRDIITGKINYNGVDELNLAYAKINSICVDYHAEWVLSWLKFWSDKNAKSDKKVTLNTLFSEKYSIHKYYDAVMKGKIK